MNPTTNFVEGKTSRSLKAAFLVLREGLAPGVAHLDGGIVAWCAPAGCGLPLRTQHPTRQLTGVVADYTAVY